MNQIKSNVAQLNLFGKGNLPPENEEELCACRQTLFGRLPERHCLVHGIIPQQEVEE